MEFKERFRNLLEENELTARKLGEILNIDHSSIYLYLQGSFPNVDNAVKLANYFNCTLNYLFGLDVYPDEYDVSENYNSSVFFERYNFLLAQNGISHYKVSKSLGFGNCSYQMWKSGRIPKIETLIKLALFFESSVDFFIGKCDN